MRNKCQYKNAKVKALEEGLGKCGCMVCRDPGVTLHHPVGQKARQNKQQVGLYWIIPLCPLHHNLLHSNRRSLEIEVNGKEYDTRWGMEKQLFNKAKLRFCLDIGRWPVPVDTDEQIQLWTY